MLSESDQLWIPKCLRFGWNLNYIPSSFETGIWKQFYTENIKALQYVPVKVTKKILFFIKIFFF
jgi:F-box protein 16